MEKKVKRYTVTGMHCAACTKHTEDAARSVPGVNDAGVSLTTGILTVSGDFDESVLFSAVRAAGYGIEKEKKRSFGEMHGKEASRLLSRLIISVVFLLPLMYISIGGMLGLPLPPGLIPKKVLTIVCACLSAVIIVINGKTYVRAVKNACRLRFDMDTLVALGSAASYAVSVAGMVCILLSASEAEADAYSNMMYFDSAAMVLTLVNLGKMLEALAKKKTTSALDALVKLRPDTITLENGETIHAEAAEVGMRFKVKAGETIGTDAVVVSGFGAVNESVITGESLPRDVSEGSSITGGTVLSGGFITAEAVAVGSETMLSKIIQEVETAGTSKSRAGRLADKVSGYFALIVMAAAAVTFTVWMIVSGDVSASAIYAAGVLVVSCPCALGLAVPAAVTVSTGKCASAGILVKDASALERAGKINRMYFDKTGTLTAGEIKVLSVFGDTDILDSLASLEAMSPHPFGKAITDYAGKGSGEVTGFLAEPGGIKGFISGSEIVAGNADYTGIGDLKKQVSDEAAKSGGSAVYCKYLGKELGMVLSDTIRPGAAAMVDALKKRGIECILLTGDGDGAASYVIKEAGLTSGKSLLKPQDKAYEIKSAQQANTVTAFVGDGINDAAALAAADVGIAFDASDVAIDAADVVILSGNPDKVNDLIAVSSKAGRVIKENLFWAFAYNALCIPLAAGVLAAAGIVITPMVGALAMSLSSLCVVLNSLRAGSVKTKKTIQKGADMKTVKIEGMMCVHCAARVKAAFAEAGIEAEINLEKGEAVLTGNPSDAVIKEIVEKAGYKVI